MASPNSTFTELVSTTFRKHKRQIADNLTNRNAFLKYVTKRGNKRVEDGGLTIVTPLDYAANGTYQRYSDWDLLDISASDVISAAEYQWRQVAINVVCSGREMRLNSGDSRIINLAKAKMKNAIRTFENNFSTDLYSDGLSTNQIDGIQKIIADTPTTGTVGGIDASVSTNAFWRNSTADISDLVTTATAANIENGLMLPLWLTLDRGPGDQPDIIVSGNSLYSLYESSQVSLKRYTDRSSADGGFTTLKYKNADVIFDGSAGPFAGQRMYFINTNYFELVVHRDADLEVMEEMRPVNQDGAVVPILWMGNLVCSNRKLQGVIKP